MTQTDGEKELVLGNKQLISLFFVVVALCGVFFAMGYMIGRNSTRMALAGAGDAATPTDSASGQRRQQASEPPREMQSDASPAPATTETPAPAPLETRPAQDTAQAPSVEPPAPVAAASAVEPGQYLQVAALQQRADADNLIRTLHEKELPAIVAPNSKDGLFHVLVGPYHQTVLVAEAKEKLKVLGFANAFVTKQ
jgi:cell division septation protein DedD